MKRLSEFVRCIHYFGKCSQTVTEIGTFSATWSSLNEYFDISRGGPELVLFCKFPRIGTQKPFLKSPWLIHHNLSCTFSASNWFTGLKFSRVSYTSKFVFKLPPFMSKIHKRIRFFNFDGPLVRLLPIGIYVIPMVLLVQNKFASRRRLQLFIFVVL